MTMTLSNTATSGTINVNGVDILTSNATGEVSARVNGSVQALSNLASVGIGQTWQDVTASRASGITYTNTTGRPIVVAASMSSANLLLNFSVNGSVVANGNSAATGGNTLTCPFIIAIPNGATYSVNGTLVRWWELR